MTWNYSAVAEPSASEADIWTPVGLKIVKTLVDDSGIEIVTVDSSIEDAINNSEPGFDLEYYDALKVLFTTQLERIFLEGDSGVLNFSLATIYGQKLERAIATAKQLREAAGN